MLDPTKIPLGRLAVAYGLSDHEIESVIESLGATFDYAWMNAEYNFLYPGLEFFSQYDKEKLTTIIEEIFNADELYYARVEGFLFIPTVSGSVFDYQNILHCLEKMRINAEEQLLDPEGTKQKYGMTLPNQEATDRMLKGLYRDKLMLAVRDMCLVNKRKSVLFLKTHDLHMQQEVKGLSRQFVEAVLNEIQAQITSSPQQNGSNKQIDSINATTAESLIVIGSILKGSHLDNDGKIGRDSFIGFTRDAMEAKGQGTLFHVTTAKEKFDNSPDLKPFKTRIGRPKSKQ